jgi:hypothetical protein
MAYIAGGKLVGKDNRKNAGPAGRENLVNQVFSPPPERPIETGVYQTAKSITSITISGSTATVTATGHGALVGNIVRISGSATKNYNGEFKVLTVADANTYTYQVFGNPSTSPSGTKLSRVRREGQA